MGAFAGPDIVENGLVLALDAADRNSYPGSGTTWTDLSGNGNNGTMIDGVNWDSSINGGTMIFSLSNDHVNCGTNSQLSPNILTIEVWFKLLDDSSWMVVNKAGVRTPGSYYIYSDSAASGRWSIFEEDRTRHDVGFGTIGVGNWVQLVGTIDNTTGIMSTYKNGIYVSGKTGASLGTSNTSDLLIGKYISGYQVNGYIPIVRIYNKILTPTETLQNFNAQKGRFGL